MNLEAPYPDKAQEEDVESAQILYVNEVNK